MMQPHQQGVMNLVKPVEQLEEMEAVQEPVDDATAEALLRCYYLAEFMNGCIVENKYEAPVTLTTSIKLSKSGARIANQAKGDGISLPESQLAAFLVAWAGDELLIDPVETNLESLRLNISSQIKRRKMNFPWIYGRRLYDAIAASPFHGRSRLSYDETIRILNDLPQGVFQLGPYIAGPYGLLEGRDWRYIVPEPYAPCYHCEEVNCDKIHRALFTTGDSGVSKAHTKIIEKVSKSHRIDVTYADAVARVQFSRMPPFSWSNNDGLPFFLFDCFSMEELRLLLAELLDNTAGRLRGDCSSVGMEVKKSIDFVQTLADAELLQLLLLASDADIHSVLNQLVWTGKLAIPLGETKSSRILQGGIGPLGVRIQASAHGVRHRPPPPLVQLRLRSIMAKCFPIDDKSSQRKLSWILREYEGGSPEARLASALASESPVAIVKKLLVSDEDYYLLALKDLGLPPSFFAAATDDEIANLISWHCGLPLPRKTLNCLLSKKE